MGTIVVSSKTQENKVMVLFTKVKAIEQIETLIDTHRYDCLDALGGNAIFCTFDMHAGYCQIPMKEKINQQLLLSLLKAYSIRV